MDSTSTVGNDEKNRIGPTQWELNPHCIMVLEWCRREQPELAGPHLAQSSSELVNWVWNSPRPLLSAKEISDDNSTYVGHCVYVSPSGKLVQIEYALKAVEAGAPSVGIRATNGVVLAVEKKFTSKLIDESTIHKIENVSKNIGMVYSGLSPDYRVLVKQARKSAQAYEMAYGDTISPEQLVVRTAAVMQEYTQSGGVRPFGVSLLIAGWDYEAKRPYLYQCDPSVSYLPFSSGAIPPMIWSLCLTYLHWVTNPIDRYNKDLELDDAVHAAILTLKESFEGQMTENNIEIGICNERGFRVLTPSEVKDYLAAIQ
ncbi:20S proteasome subunit alpha 2 [Clonorchis sinensis]|uniref:20S proteasome subunit alpha 2 n=1 Tax=Clonorchis sinensis TaxID=79923 RepID=G7YKN0_CLOSI|nr:20S proteasome subunit alpha 2 [Clonorchis sinensis]